MATGCWLLPEDSPCEFHNKQWSHSSFLTSIITSKTSALIPWVSITDTQRHHELLHRATPKRAFSLQALKRKRLPSDHGSFGWGCGVRSAGVIPPRHHGFYTQPSPSVLEEQAEANRDLRWQREHLLLTSKHLPSRAPLPDKGKPAVRRGRKATDQISDVSAGLPEEE